MEECQVGVARQGVATLALEQNRHCCWIGPAAEQGLGSGAAGSQVMEQIGSYIHCCAPSMGTAKYINSIVLLLTSYPSFQMWNAALFRGMPAWW
jgi:hypothetical protein